MEFNPALRAGLDRVNFKVPVSTLSIDHSSNDIRAYVEEGLRYVEWDPSVKSEVRTRILDQANGNFLWVHLILEEIKECHSDDDIRATLSELPPGMEALYRRMETSISQRIRRPFDRRLSRQLFLWATYARESLTVEELASILEADFGRILDMTSTLARLCGHFVVIEGDNRIGLLHQTAREYLVSAEHLPFSLDANEAHEELFQKSVCVFMGNNLRSRLSNVPESFSLFSYRATSWAYHLTAPSNGNTVDHQLDTLCKFFGDTAVLIWIQVLSSLGQLGVLIDT
ncbi:hypothetical protein SLS62_004696 [Diatrype stigma]|uniref:GPI inositol-deacylase winged helix domain-containing protein n=1 Tax=Diatrype stigma TaxID=117547 RepID=A0AAN9UQZ9_9PEZI